MSALQPVAVYAMRIPPGIGMVPAVPDFAAMFRITMAAIDPSEEITEEAVGHKGPPRATLKVIRVPDELMDDEDSDDEDYLEGLDDEDESDSDDEANGGPSDKKAKKMLEALAEDDDDEMDDDEEDEVDAAAVLKKFIKGKGLAVDGEDDEDEDEDDEDVDSLADELEETVICTLDPEKQYQQPIDFVVSEGEKIFFQVTGTHTIYLTGNYVMPLDDGRASLYDDEDEEDDYDLSPDEDELDLEALEALEDEESDDLDDLEDPRIMEVDTEEETTKPKKSKGKKRPADDSEEDEKVVGLDEIMAKSLKEEATVNGDSKKISKAEKKAAKKLKKNDGEAAPIAASTPETKETKKDAPANGSEKKVQFSKDLVQGPTPSATPPPSKKDANKKDDKKSAEPKATKPTTTASGSLGVRDLNGVTVDDRKLGSGPAAKKGSKLELRYIGKLDNGKVFDSNKAGKPFSVKLGQGEVIKGWDVGLMGITAGGERRLTIPPGLAYGNKALPGIPKNSKLIFDVKCLSIK